MLSRHSAALPGKATFKSMPDLSGFKAKTKPPNLSQAPDRSLLLRFRHIYAGKGGWFYMRRQRETKGDKGRKRVSSKSRIMSCGGQRTVKNSEKLPAEDDPESVRIKDIDPESVERGEPQRSSSSANEEAQSDDEGGHDSSLSSCFSSRGGVDELDEVDEVDILDDVDEVAEVFLETVDITGCDEMIPGSEFISPRRVKNKSRVNIFSRMSQEAQWAISDTLKDMCPPNNSPANERVNDDHVVTRNNKTDCLNEVASISPCNEDFLSRARQYRRHNLLNPVLQTRVGDAHQRGRHVLNNLITQETPITAPAVTPYPPLLTNQSKGPLQSNRTRLPDISKSREDLTCTESSVNEPSKFKYVDSQGNSTLFNRPVFRENTFEITPPGYDSRFHRSLYHAIDDDIPEEVKDDARKKCTIIMT
ncbi:hypothetical protein CAPTEDRAFT_185210 [Capitella teleta]|uniref:Uncharacterized protein n=1 Tax=Capitella teleta TaxID=283909 RepID=R7VGD5_CAPTE|nr:hypothetical protein CAPTEDRAFT_185210 [Capitella teleta]|eukprot:ELU17632.1 hypothetical protein CAPTEDRAFT_185210 [Capitella teleta]